MPLNLREKRDHYPDDYAKQRFMAKGHVVLSGGYQVGTISPSIKLRQEHRLDWGGGFADWFSHGTVDTIDEAKAFRHGIARAGVIELQDAKPGPPVRDPPEVPLTAYTPPQPYGDIDHPVAILNPRRMTVYAGLGDQRQAAEPAGLRMEGDGADAGKGACRIARSL